MPCNENDNAFGPRITVRYRANLPPGRAADVSRQAAYSGPAAMTTVAVAFAEATTLTKLFGSVSSGRATFKNDGFSNRRSYDGLLLSQPTSSLKW